MTLAGEQDLEDRQGFSGGGSAQDGGVLNWIGAGSGAGGKRGGLVSEGNDKGDGAFVVVAEAD